MSPSETYIVVDEFGSVFEVDADELFIESDGTLTTLTYTAPHVRESRPVVLVSEDDAVEVEE